MRAYCAVANALILTNVLNMYARTCLRVCVFACVCVCVCVCVLLDRPNDLMLGRLFHGQVPLHVSMHTSACVSKCMPAPLSVYAEYHRTLSVYLRTPSVCIDNNVVYER